MLKIEIKIEYDHQAEKIIDVLREAEEEGTINFSFNTCLSTIKEKDVN